MCFFFALENVKHRQYDLIDIHKRMESESNRQSALRRTPAFQAGTENQLSEFHPNQSGEQGIRTLIAPFGRKLV